MLSLPKCRHSPRRRSIPEKLSSGHHHGPTWNSEDRKEVNQGAEESISDDREIQDGNHARVKDEPHSGERSLAGHAVSRHFRNSDSASAIVWICTNTALLRTVFLRSCDVFCDLSISVMGFRYKHGNDYLALFGTTDCPLAWLQVRIVIQRSEYRLPHFILPCDDSGYPNHDE